jgi:hypothetical protein
MKESPIHELSSAVLFGSILLVFSDIDMMTEI